MIRVLGGYLTGEQETTIDGRSIRWDNVKLSIETDDVPADMVEKGYFGNYADEIKFSRKDVKRIGFNDYSEILGREVELVYSVFGGKPRIVAVKLLPKG